MKKFKVSKKQVLLWLLVFLVQITFSASTIAVISPFGYSFAFALNFAGLNGFIIAIFYFVSQILHVFSFESLISSALVCALIVLLSIIKFTSKKHKLYWLFVCTAFSRLANIYFSFSSTELVLWAILELCLGLCFSYIAYIVIKALLERGIQCFTTLEKAFVCTMIVAAFIGLSGLYIFDIDISKFIFTLIILVCSAAISTKTVFVACFMCLAGVLGGNYSYAINYFVFACATCWLTPKNKFLSASVVCLIDSLFGLFLNYNLLSLIPCLVAVIAFLAIPNRLLKMAGEYIYGTKKSLISAYYLTKKQEIVKSKLDNMANMFNEMQNCYRNLASGKVTDDKYAELLASELKSKLCESCINKINCYSGKDMSPCFASLIDRAIKKGKVNFLDVPNLLSSNCNRINACLSQINQMAEEHARESKKAKDADTSKLSISLQLGGTSRIFKQLSSEFDNSERINGKKSKQICDQILLNGLVCRECIVTENAQGVSEIAVIVRSIDAVNPMLQKACEKVYPIRFERKVCYQTKAAGWSLVSFVPLSRYELVCGYASTPKNVGDKCGDNYLFTKLSDNKYLVAICDGMGHGEEANNVSAVAINLIESFYKCGLSSQIVLDSVNNLLLPSGGTFTTVDASIVDTCTGEVDFIKIGSTISVIKGQESSTIIGVESLPLGIVEGVIPSTSKNIMYAGDVAVLASDGVVDVFANHEEFSNFINNERVINMQLFAENILEEAQSRNPKNKDDMTVIAYRLIQKK